MICVVEDNVEISNLWVAICAGAGYDVEVFPDSEAALAKFVPRRYQGALLDLRLPGLSGLSLGLAMRDRDPDLPLIALTGDSNQALSTNLCPPFELVMVKPIRRDDLLAVIERYFPPRTGSLLLSTC
jgi:DNA-binding response OmpR family regulator